MLDSKARWVFHLAKFSLCNIKSESPDSTKANAVFAFIAIHIGKILLRAVMSKAQPIKTIKPIKITKILAINEKDLNKETILVFD